MATMIHNHHTSRQNTGHLHDGEVIIGALLWIASVARVAGGIAGDEVFGAEATLALLCVIFLPWAYFRDSSGGHHAKGGEP